MVKNDDMVRLVQERIDLPCIGPAVQIILENDDGVARPSSMTVNASSRFLPPMMPRPMLLHSGTA